MPPASCAQPVHLQRVSRRTALRWLGAAGITLSLGQRLALAPRVAAAQPVDDVSELADRFAAVRLRIATPGDGGGRELDLRRDYGAAGDGSRDDGSAFRALAADVNAGRVPAGSVVHVPAGTYRVVGNEPVVFTRPIVLRGATADTTTIRLQYTGSGARFLRVAGQGVYEMHTTAVFPSGRAANIYPQASFAAIRSKPLRGDIRLDVDRPELFAPGDNVYVLCDDFGPEITYAPGNRRLEHFLLKQHCAVTRVEGNTIWLDAPLRHDFLGNAPRLYRWQPVIGFGIEHLTIDDQSSVRDSDRATTFIGVEFDGVVDGWVWDVRFTNSTSIPLRLARSRRIVVSESLFDGARHVGAGGNGYLPQLFMTDDSLVEYSTVVGGRHALICDWSCWGNVFRYNRVRGSTNVELHGEYSVENLYLRNDFATGTLDTGGGGDQSHAHDGPFNEMRGNRVLALRTLKKADRQTRRIDNWYSADLVDNGQHTQDTGNHRVESTWNDFPFAAACGREHTLTFETARPAADAHAKDA